MANLNHGPRVEKVRVSTGKLTLTGEIHTPENPQFPLPGLIICHGIPAVRKTEGNGGYSELAGRFADVGFSTMIFNFRGTGESGGNFDILGWMEDLDAVLTCFLANQNIDKNRISVMGFSGGAAVSICAAAGDRRINAVVSCASPARWDRIGEWESAKTFLSHARSVGIVRDPDFPPDIDEWWDNFQRVIPADRVGLISPRRLLLIHGEDDDVVPFHHANDLFNLARSPKEIIRIPGEGHRLRLSAPAMDAAVKWLCEVNGLRSIS